MFVLFAAPGIKQVWDAKLTHKLALKLAKHVFKAFSNVYDVKDYVSLHSNTITAAASSGIVEIVKMCLQMFPHTIWLSIDQQTILKVAVQHRQEKILNLVHNMVVYNKFTSPQLIDVSTKDTILHLAAKLAPPANLRIVPGVALQMQREVQWFKVLALVKTHKLSLLLTLPISNINYALTILIYVPVGGGEIGAPFS